MSGLKIASRINNIKTQIEEIENDVKYFSNAKDHLIKQQNSGNSVWIALGIVEGNLKKKQELYNREKPVLEKEFQKVLEDKLAEIVKSLHEISKEITAAQQEINSQKRNLFNFSIYLDAPSKLHDEAKKEIEIYQKKKDDLTEKVKVLTSLIKKIKGFDKGLVFGRFIGESLNGKQQLQKQFHSMKVIDNIDEHEKISEGEHIFTPGIKPKR